MVVPEICAILDGIYVNMDHDIDLHTTHNKDPKYDVDQHKDIYIADLEAGIILLLRSTTPLKN